VCSSAPFLANDGNLASKSARQEVRCNGSRDRLRPAQRIHQLPLHPGLSTSVHDLSAVGLDADSGLPRFNMPFELGIAVGLKKATRMYASHSLLVLEHQKYSYQRCLSDIAGQDLQAHGNDCARLIPIVRNWLRKESRRTDLPGGARINAEFKLFQADLPRICAEADLDREALPFIDLLALVQEWLNQSDPTPKARSTDSSSAASHTTVRRTA